MLGPSESLLNAEQKLAEQTRGYNSLAARQKIYERFKDIFDGRAPYNWQVDVTEAILLGLDCITIAGTGSGKTMPFAMPLLLDETKKKIVIVISPLNDLEVEQV